METFTGATVPVPITTTANDSKIVALAGATGDLGSHITDFLLKKGGAVRALVRKGSAPEKTETLRQKGAQILEVDFNDVNSLKKACTGASCVVSTLSGLRDVIVDVQTRLLRAAVESGVPRFIPSDYCIDYTKLPTGSNRNLDLRREFSMVLNSAPIAATSILNGMFTDLLTGQAPVVLFGPKLVVYWGNASQAMDFTTIKNTAEFTAAAALDDTTPRFLQIAGEVSDINGLAKSAEQATGEKFRTFRAGSLGAFNVMIKITKTLFPARNEVFPAWQGMQYLHNMFSGLPKLTSLDNHRYPDITWTPIREVLEKRE